MLRTSMMKRNLKMMREHRKYLKKKYIENKKIKEKGTNFPVNFDETNNWKNKKNKKFPFLL